MPIDLLQEIRSSCAAVAARAMHVRVNHGRIPSYAARLPVAEASAPLPSPDPACHYLGRGDDTVAYFLTLDAVNFGSGYFPSLRKRDDMSGYFTVASRLNDHFREHGPLSAGQLAELSADDCTRIFRQQGTDGTVRELMELFTAALNDLGAYLAEHFRGSFAALVAAAGQSAERLAGMLTHMPFFADEAFYDGIRVKFLKRAQITAADLYLAFGGQGPGRFDDIDRLTIFADNLVPHVLRLDGILDYDGQLPARIERGEEVPSGSPEEIEIRACAVHACELIVEELHRMGKKANSMLLDQYLWNRGQLPEIRKHPRHRTRTVFY